MLQDDYEEFSASQLKTLERYVTNTTGHIFALRNLPEVIKGALFSRYSRSSLGLRSLLLKEFVDNSSESAFQEISGSFGAQEETDPDQSVAIKRAQNFYDRILDGYGDDSIGELGGAHLAIENVSMIAAKQIEDCRLGGSPLEKSTRYIYFDQKVKGEYLFYRDPILMTSAYRDTYINTCQFLFETYSKLIPPLTAKTEELFPCDESTSKSAYNASIRAKVLDSLRGLLPAGTLTNMGVFGNGRFFEHLIHKLHCSNLAEFQEIGKRSHEELSKVIPSFVRRADLNHKTHKSYASYHESMNHEISQVAIQSHVLPNLTPEQGVHLVSHDKDPVVRVAAGLLFSSSNKSLRELMDYCSKLPEDEMARILEAACSCRENRRDRSPRGLEHAFFTFEILTDFGIYRDLHRHRILTQERQLLSCEYSYYTPPEIIGLDIETDYHNAMEKAKEAFDLISKELPEEAQYVVPMAYNVRWYFHINLRALQWLCELRSQAAGHPGYRHVAQKMAKEIYRAVPEFERFFKFVDFEDTQLGRLSQEKRKAEKAEMMIN